MKLLFTDEEEFDKNIIESVRLSNDTIFKKYKVSENDVIKIKENEIALLVDEGKVLDIKEIPGIYNVDNKLENEEINELDDIVIRNSENETLCVLFLNTDVIKGNKYIISNPIKYNDWKNDESSEIYIKLEGTYDFKIENPKMFIKQVIGLRNTYTKQELIEKIRKYVLKSIEEGINEVSIEYKLDIEELEKSSKELEVKLKQNEYDMKLLDYGVKLTYFDITNLEIAKKKFKIF